MTKSLEQQLGPDAAEIIKLHRHINGQARGLLDSAIRAGELLCGAKESLDHGDWLPWCEENLPEIAKRTIQRYMACFKNKNSLKDAQIEDLTKAYKAISLPNKIIPKYDSESDLNDKYSENNAIPPGIPRDSEPEYEPRKTAPAKPIPAAEVLDKTGFVIPNPSPAMECWTRSQEVQELLTAISRVRGRLEKAQEDKDKLFSEITFSTLTADLSNAFTHLKCGVPFAVCPTCQGRALSPCQTCKSRGTVSELYWKRYVTQKDKDIRAKVVLKRKDKK